MAPDPYSANFDDYSPSESYLYLLKSGSATAKGILPWQITAPYPPLDAVDQRELPLGETPPDMQPADVNDTPGIHSVCPTPMPLPPLSSQAVASFCPPKWHRIPQTPYNLKQWDFTQSKPIMFQMDGFPGMNMGKALRKTFTALQGRDDLMFQDAGIAISFRLWFPGYPLNGSPQISTRYWDRTRNPITRSKLAHQVAKKLEKYLNSMRTSHVMDPSVDDRWRIGEGFMRLDNMFLAKLVHVSKGSFQAELWVVDNAM